MHRDVKVKLPRYCLEEHSWEEAGRCTRAQARWGWVRPEEARAPRRAS